MYNVVHLKVHEFCSLLSDAHSPVALSLSFNNHGHKDSNLTNIRKEKIRLWDASNIDSFRTNIQMTDFEPIYLSFNQIEAKQHISSNDVNSIVNKINECFLKCAEKIFGKVKCRILVLPLTRHSTDQNVKLCVKIGIVQNRDIRYIKARKIKMI